MEIATCECKDGWRYPHKDQTDHTGYRMHEETLAIVNAIYFFFANDAHQVGAWEKEEQIH